uniref:Variant surface glycoprotein 1068 n=1 Tax=Trypanosoma brucei TaxID=5691 RepID=M4SUI4_9TRYP|nr:variant surface glycoprotein 1068 [Trypanosoma brucei]
MATQQITLMFLLTAAVLQRSDSAALDANDNAKYFSSLCAMIKLATTKLTPVQDIPDTGEFAAVAELVNLSYTAPDALKQIADTKMAVNNIDTADSPANKYCKDGKTATCIKLAQLIGEGTKTNHVTTFLQRLRGKSPNTDILAMAAEVSKAIKDINAIKPDHSLAEAQKDINAALEGKETGDATANELKGESDRVKTCGKAGGGSATAGTVAGKSLAHDALCMCGTDIAANQKDACGIDVHTNSAHAFTWGQASTQDKQWQNLKKACTQSDETAILSSAQIRTVTENYLNKLATGQLSKAYFPGTIGYTESSQTTGCDGQKGGTNGACVFYGKAEGAKLENKLEWRKKLLSAAANIDDAIKGRQQQLHLLSHVKALNATLTALVLMTETIAKTQPPGTGASTETQKAKVMEEKKKECATHKDNKTACENAGKCKWKGVSSEKGECEVDETKVTTQGNAAAGTGEGAAGTTTKKFKGKLETDSVKTVC